MKDIVTVVFSIFLMFSSVALAKAGASTKTLIDEILFAGDSIGYDTADEIAIKMPSDTKMQNVAVGGSLWAQVPLQTSGYAPIKGGNNVVVISCGTNDLRNNKESVIDALQDARIAVNKIEEQGWDVWVETIIPRFDVTPASVAEYNAGLSGIGASRVINTFSYFTNADGSVKTDLYEEGKSGYTHPNRDGDNAIATAVASQF